MVMNNTYCLPDFANSLSFYKKPSPCFLGEELAQGPVLNFDAAATEFNTGAKRDQTIPRRGFAFHEYSSPK
jgi:hypothetical protein